MNQYDECKLAKEALVKLKLSRVQVATLSCWSGPSSPLAKLTVRHVWYVSLHVVLKLSVFTTHIVPNNSFFSD